MRDPERIDQFMEKLGELWKKYPDYRFGQLLMNLQRNPCNQLEFQDPWNWEEDEWEERIANYNVPELTDEEIYARAKQIIDQLSKDA